MWKNSMLKLLILVLLFVSACAPNQTPIPIVQLGTDPPTSEILVEVLTPTLTVTKTISPSRNPSITPIQTLTTTNSRTETPNPTQFVDFDHIFIHDFLNSWILDQSIFSNPLNSELSLDEVENVLLEESVDFRNVNLYTNISYLEIFSNPEMIFESMNIIYNPDSNSVLDYETEIYLHSNYAFDEWSLLSPKFIIDFLKEPSEIIIHTHRYSYEDKFWYFIKLDYDNLIELYYFGNQTLSNDIFEFCPSWGTDKDLFKVAILSNFNNRGDGFIPSYGLFLTEVYYFGDFVSFFEGDKYYDEIIAVLKSGKGCFLIETEFWPQP